MTLFDDLVERLTHRLRIDPELRMDVANELRAHLEDSASEFRAAGYAEADSQEKAREALGDEKELAESLWQANRRRIRLRQAIKWTCRVTLLPAAVAVIAAIVWGMMGSVRSGAPALMPVPITMDSNIVYPKDLSPEQKLILYGDASAASPTDVSLPPSVQRFLRSELGRRVLAEKSISDRWPDNPVYYANYATAWLSYYQTKFDPDELDQGKLQYLLAILDKGEKLEKDNSFYNFSKAGLLFQASTRLKEDPSLTYDSPARSVKPDAPKMESVSADKLEIVNPEMFQQGLREFHAGLRKPQYKDHADDMLNIRLGLLPQPQRWSEFVLRMQMSYSVLIPFMSPLRNAAKVVGSYSVELARQHKLPEALELDRGVVLMGERLAKNNPFLIEILVAEVIQDRGLVYTELARREGGSPQQAQQAREDRLRWGDVYHSIHNKPHPFADPAGRRTLGLMWNIILPALPTLDWPNPAPMRLSEYAVLDQMMLVAILAAVVGLAGVFLAVTGLSLLLHRRRPAGPKLLFAGWRRIGWICLCAILLPLGVFAAFSYVPALSFRHYGLNYTYSIFLAEYAVLAAIVIVLLLRSSYLAIRQRAAEAGMPVPPPAGKRKWVARFLWAMLILSLAVSGALWRWMDGQAFLGITPVGYSIALAVAAALFVLGYLVLAIWRLATCRGDLAHFRRSFFRSAGPILASAVIVMGIVCGFALANMETVNVRQIQGNAGWDIRNEVDRSAFRELRDAMAADHDRLMKEYFSSASTQPAEK